MTVDRLALIALAFLASTANAGPGKLLIAGGAVAADNSAIHRALLDNRLPGASTIAVIPSASGIPAQAIAALRQALVRHGASPADVVGVHIARIDDPATPDDESRWADNATNPSELAKVARAGAIWFTGGDQARTRQLLVDAGGADTPLLAAIRRRLTEGALVGGTSAGAAIMSPTMIYGGTSMAALTGPVRTAPSSEAGDALVLGPGLGFLPVGLVDQHFDAQARLGRLARALFELPPERRIGFGIDEDTALLIDQHTGVARVIGTSTVTLLDARTAQRLAGDGFAAEALSLSVLAAGDGIALRPLAGLVATGRAPPAPPDTPPAADSAGLAVPVRPLAEQLAGELLARDGVAAIDRTSFAGSHGLTFRFERRPTSAAHDGEDATGTRRISITDVGLSLRPVRLTITPAR